jgi:NADPH2:quinone reductase
MKAVIIRQTGGPDVLEVVDQPTPTPGPGQALIRHEAVGLNFIDTYHRTGLYPIKLPATLGSEAAGVVEAVGEGVNTVKAGDRVAYAQGAGAYADMNVVAAERLVAVPDGVSFQVAAAALLKGMTAEFLADRISPWLKPGEPVLVHAAAGGVGGILTQWLKVNGQLVIAAVGGPAKAKIARDHGADHVLDYDKEDVAARVREITDGAGVRVVYDSVGKATFEASLASLGRRGLMVCYGNASGPPPAIEPTRLSRLGSLYLTRPTLWDYVATRADLEASAAALFDRIAKGSVKIEIGQTWPLVEARKAHEALEGRATTGATVLIP